MVVIGSGAGGGTVAHVLTALGVRVTLLEAGPMLDPYRDFKEHQWPYAVDHRGAEEGGKQYFGRGKQGGYFITTSGGWELEGEPYTVGDGSEFQWFRSRIIGGRTNHYGRMSFRFSDYDFKPYDRDGLGTNWPIDYDDIAPYYDKAETLIGVTGSHEGIRSAPDGVFQDPPPPKAHELLIKAASERLGIPCIPNRRAILTRPLNGRPACHYCGQCGRGCRAASNYSSSQVQIFPALETGRLRIIDQAMAREIVTDGNGKVTDVIYMDKRTHQEQRVRCRVLVLAASACESARILLNSKTSEFPNGVANSSGVVGRFLMDTVGYGLSARVPSLEGLPRYNSDGAGGAHLYMPWWGWEQQQQLGFPRGYHIEIGGGYGMPGIGSFARVARESGYGTGLKAQARREYGTSISFQGRGEMIPNNFTYCEIDPGTAGAHLLRRLDAVAADLGRTAGESPCCGFISSGATTSGTRPDTWPRPSARLSTPWGAWHAGRRPATPPAFRWGAASSTRWERRVWGATRAPRCSTASARPTTSTTCSCAMGHHSSATPTRTRR